MAHTRRLNVPRLCLALAVLALGIAQSHVSTASANSAPPESVALRLSDLPSGFIPISAHVVPVGNAAINQGLSVSTLRKQGRVRGYTVAYARDTGAGFSYVASEVVQYRSGSGAGTEYVQGILGDTAFRRLPAFHFIQVALTRTVLVAFRVKTGSYSEERQVLDSRDGSYYFWIEAHYVAGTEQEAAMVYETVQLAAAIRKRMASGVAAAGAPPPNPAPAATATVLPMTGHLETTRCRFKNPGHSDSAGLLDTYTSIWACVLIRDPLGLANFSGYFNTSGEHAPVGWMYLHPWVYEWNERPTAGSYTSSPSNFAARGQDGRLFHAHAGAPYGRGKQRLKTAVLAKGHTNPGWIELEVPEHDGPYTLLWNEHGLIPFTPTAVLRVFPSH